MNNKRYTTDELSEVLGLPRRAIDNLRKQGKIPFLKIGMGRGKFLFILSDVEEALKTLSEENQKEAAAEFEKQKNIAYGYSYSGKVRR